MTSGYGKVYSRIGQCHLPKPANLVTKLEAKTYDGVQSGPMKFRDFKFNRFLFFKYSLGTLFIVIFLLGIPLAIFRKNIEEAYRQKQTINWVVQHQGTYFYQHYSQADFVRPEPPTPGWLRNLIGDDYFFQLEVIDFSKSNVSNLSSLPPSLHVKMLYLDNTLIADITPLSNFKSINHLVANNSPIENISPLSQLHDLEFLYLSGTKVTDLQPLSRLDNMILIEVNDTPLSDLSPLINQKSLVVLCINNTSVTDLSPLAQMNGLDRFELSGTKVEDLTPIQNLHTLRYLDISGTKVRNLRPIDRLYLTHLILCGCQISEKEIDTYQRLHPSCKITRPNDPPPAILIPSRPR
ncbi:MAG: hypothetical protein COA78_11925 [Blastopirellula sp.]|nr:MAG: hypothetical protein COA78_11925 [Blastopirellula sp.]